MSKNTGGRPKTYTDDKLLNILEEYIDSHSGEKIVLSKLARETSVPRHIWDYSDKVKIIIEKLNNPVLVATKLSDEVKIIASVESTVEQSLSTPKKRRVYVETCTKVINDLMKKVDECYELEKTKNNLEKQVNELKNENRQLKEQIKNQEIAMLELCIDSESLKKRNLKGLKNNIIKIDADNIEKTVAITEKDIKEQFPWLND